MVFRLQKDQPSVGDVHMTSSLSAIRGPQRWRKSRRLHGKVPHTTIRTPKGMLSVAPSREEMGKNWSTPVKIVKADPDQQLIFGWASVVEKDGVAVIDKQGDVIPVSELENAAYDFVLDFRHNDDMHQRPQTGRLVESMVFTREKQEALGIDLKKVAWWVGFKVHDEQLWQAHKRGERPEFSIGGAAVPIELDDVEKTLVPTASSSDAGSAPSPHVSVAPHIHMPEIHMPPITMPEVTINTAQRRMKKTVTTRRDADGNLTADITEALDEAGA